MTSTPALLAAQPEVGRRRAGFGEGGARGPRAGSRTGARIVAGVELALQCLNQQLDHRPPLGGRAGLQARVEVVVDAGEHLPHAAR